MNGCLLYLFLRLCVLEAENVEHLPSGTESFGHVLWDCKDQLSCSLLGSFSQPSTPTLPDPGLPNIRNASAELGLHMSCPS
jgi:hypothetical protein